MTCTAEERSIARDPLPADTGGWEIMLESENKAIAELGFMESGFKKTIDIREAIASSRLFREKLLSDAYRPRYHFAIPEDMGQPGDPNGAFYANGRYHLMYLYNCTDDKYRFGHISSADLLHWRSHPDALTADDLDGGGIFSGGAFADDDGTVYLAYWGLPHGYDAGERDGSSGVRIAYSNDIANHYEKWEKFSEYALKSTRFGIIEVAGEDGDMHLAGCADPSNIWKAGGLYYLQTGNYIVLNSFRDDSAAPQRYRGDWADLFSSRDLRKWDYEKRFYARDAGNGWTDESEDCMCPSFLPLPDAKEGGLSGKYLQLFISHNKGCQYYIGSYDKANSVFVPERHGRMSWNDNTVFAPEALIDKDGRQIMWAWLRDNLPDELQRGWSGVFCLPRSLWLNKDGGLGIAPVSEMEGLRYNHKKTLDVCYGTSCEVKIVFDVSPASKAGLKVRCAPDESEYTLIYYDCAGKRIVFDAAKSGRLDRLHFYPAPAAVEAAPFELKDNEYLTLDIFIDSSVIEVFINERQAIARRVYSERGDSKGIKLFSEGRVEVKSLDVWEIAPTNFY